MKSENDKFEDGIRLEGSGADHAVEPMPREAKIFWSCFGLFLLAAISGAVHFFS